MFSDAAVQKTKQTSEKIILLIFFSGWMELSYITSELLSSVFTFHNSKTEQHAIKLIGDYDIVAAAVCRCLHHPIC